MTAAEVEISWPDDVDLRDGACSFAELAAVSPSVVTITGSTLEPAPVSSATDAPRAVAP